MLCALGQHRARNRTVAVARHRQRCATCKRKHEVLRRSREHTGWRQTDAVRDAQQSRQRHGRRSAPQRARPALSGIHSAMMCTEILDRALSGQGWLPPPASGTACSLPPFAPPSTPCWLAGIAHGVAGRSDLTYSLDSSAARRCHQSSPSIRTSSPLRSNARCCEQLCAN